MLAEVNKYRGFSLNIEMVNGKFIPTYQDSLRGNNPQTWYKLEDCVAETQNEAIAKAHKKLDEMIEKELADTPSHWIDPSKGPRVNPPINPPST
jgi:hypothetical protein